MTVKDAGQRVEADEKIQEKLSSTFPTSYWPAERVQVSLAAFLAASALMWTARRKSRLLDRPKPVLPALCQRAVCGCLPADFPVVRSPQADSRRRVGMSAKDKDAKAAAAAPTPPVTPKVGISGQNLKEEKAQVWPIARLRAAASSRIE
jgi:hypothetical protein